MKLITHNLLMCNRKGCTQNNFPLNVAATKFEDFDSEQSLEFTKGLMQRLFEKLDLAALKKAVLQLGWDLGEVPPAITPDLMENEAFLQQMHHLLIRRQIVEGQLACPNCERVYEIKNGIPNMLLREDEV